MSGQEVLRMDIRISRGGVGSGVDDIEKGLWRGMWKDSSRV